MSNVQPHHTPATGPYFPTVAAMEIANKSASSASGPIIAGNCLSCMGMVRIPQSTSVNATVRCPHCHELFVLADLLEQTMPALEVIPNQQGKPGANVDGEAPYIDTLHIKRQSQTDDAQTERPRTKFEIPKALKDGAKRKRKRRRRRSSSTSGSTDPGKVSSSSNFERSSDSRSSSGSRSKRRVPDSSGEIVELAPHRGRVKSRNGHTEPIKVKTEDIVKVGLGAVLAFPVAYLMLFWIFKADPLGIAGPVSKVLPFAVPASLHADAEETERPELLPAVSSSENFDSEPEMEFSAPVSDAPILRSDREDKRRIAIPDIDPNEVFGQEFGL